MLSFFRRIRIGLLGSAQGQKYLIYAIGEITLVVIGILIALQINNWNGNRIDKIKEKALIKLIYDESEQHLAYVGRFINTFMVPKGESLRILLLNQNEDLLEQNSRTFWTNHLYKAFISPAYTPPEAVSVRIINSDAFELIQFDSLKQLILQLDNSIKQNKKAYGPIENQVIWPILVEKDLWNLDVMKMVGDDWELKLFDHLNPTSHDYNYEQILTNEDAESIISAQMMFTSFILLRLQDQKDLIKQILDFIEHHYNLN